MRPLLALLFLLLGPFGWLAGGAGKQFSSIVKLELAALFPDPNKIPDTFTSDVARAVTCWSLIWDFAFIPVYAGFLFLLCGWLGQSSQRQAKGFAVAALLTGIFDAIESSLVLWALEPADKVLTTPLKMAFAATAAKYLLLGAVLLWCAWKLLLLRRDISKVLRQLRDVFRPIWFHVTVVIGLSITMMFVPQAQEVVRRIGEIPHSVLPGLGFVFCTGLWAWTSWFWARFLLSARFIVGRELRTPAALWFMEWIPRLLAWAAFVGSSTALFRGTLDGTGSGGWKSQLIRWGAIQLLAGFLFFIFLANRRRLMGRLRLSSYLGEKPSQRTVDKLVELLDQGATRVAIGLSLGIGLVVGTLFTFAPVGTGRYVGSAAALLLAGCAWIPTGSLLVYCGRRYDMPVFRFLALLAIGASFVNDNHSVQPVAGPSEVPRRLTLSQRLNEWHDRIHKDHPEETNHHLYLVASEGGGIRAAYWTAAVLAQLEQKSQGEFSERLFAISSVSGGSLGAAVFATQLADGRPRELLVEEARHVLGEDLLSSGLGALLFPDALQRFIPFAVLPDRAQALESSWESAWCEHQDTSCPDSKGLKQPFTNLRNAPPGGAPRPSLFFNATSAEEGKRVIVSDVDLSKEPAFADADDALVIAGQNLRVSTAAHLGARFPYISPAASFQEGRTHLVDGGYFDNSGASTIQDILTALHAYRDGRHTVEPVILFITNGAEEELSSSSLLAELLVPIKTLTHTIGAHTVHAQEALSRQSGSKCLQFKVMENMDVPLPLGWYLSELARNRIDETASRVSWEQVLSCDSPASCSCGPFGDKKNPKFTPRTASK